MTLTDELKLLGDKIKTNQVQYDLDREPAKISVLSSKKMNKYGYLTGEDVGQILNKILKRDDRVNQFNK